jgi:hypothetical protein
MNADCIAWHPGRFLIEPAADVDPDLRSLPRAMALELCQRIIAACADAVKKATQRDTPRLVIAR